MPPTVTAAATEDRGHGLFSRTWLQPDGLPTAPVLTNVRVAGRPRDRAGGWLRVAMVALAVLAAIAAVVSYQAQDQMILAYKHAKLIAALQAAIPDVAALCFAATGIALALHGKRALRPRILNVAAVGTSVYMNAIAASNGWKALSVWILAPVAYAVTSDTLIGVVRSYTLARLRDQDDEATPMAMVGGALLYCLRFLISPGSTARGIRQALIDATPLPEPPAHVNAKAAAAAGKRAIEARPARDPAGRTAQTRERRGSKTARFLALVADHAGPFAGVPLAEVYRISSELAPQVDLDPGSARTALRRAVLAAQQGGERP